MPVGSQPQSRLRGIRTPSVQLRVRAQGPLWRFALGPAPLAGDVGARRKPAQTTDGHLVALAAAHGARLVTLGEGVPQWVVIPTA